jgi:hypothetical protein
MNSALLLFVVAVFSASATGTVQNEDSEVIELRLVGRAAEGTRAVGDPPAVSPLRGPARDDGTRLHRLVGSYTYVYDETCEAVTVPEHFVTDFASIPQALRMRHNPADYAEAALVHDWLYAVGTNGDEEAREKADDVFKALLLETGIRRRRARELHLAVRAGGGAGFGKPSDFAFWSPVGRQVYEEDPAEKPSDPFREVGCEG